VQTRVIRFQGNEWRKKALLLAVGKLKASINQSNKEERILVGGGEALSLIGALLLLRHRLELGRGRPCFALDASSLLVECMSSFVRW
jgi:uncharacterized membrane protein YhhN